MSFFLPFSIETCLGLLLRWPRPINGPREKGAASVSPINSSFSFSFIFTATIFNDAAADKIRKYRADYNNRPPSAVSFMPAIASTSGRLQREFVRLLFLQAHRETDRFFAASGVQ